MLRKITDNILQNKTILLRADFNVPLHNGSIADASRIDAVLPTIKFLLSHNNKIVIISHLGRPEGIANNKYSLLPVFEYLKNIYPFAAFIESDITKWKQAVDRIEYGNIALIENIRFHKGEEDNNINFARELAKLGEVYVNDAFACSHRFHASIDQVSSLLPSYAGLLMEKEISHLERFFYNPEKPMGAVIGGSKVSSKIQLLASLMKICDVIILGGAMSNSFLKLSGVNIGSSICSEDDMVCARKIIEIAKKSKVEIITPIDFIVSNNINDHQGLLLNINDNLEDKAIFDIGPSTIRLIKDKIHSLKTIIWNGPLGVFEKEVFSNGTISIARIISELTKDNKLSSLVGGGDSVAAIQKLDDQDRNFSFISTGGGAFLEWLENGKLEPLRSLYK